MTQELVAIRAELAKARNRQQLMGTVTAVNEMLQTADLEVAFGEDTVAMPGVSLQGNYLPDIGSQVPIRMFGKVPVIEGPAGSATSTTSGRVAARGSDSVLENGDMEKWATQLIRDSARTMETTVEDWIPGANNTLDQSSTFAQAGTYSLRLTCTVANGTPTAAIDTRSQTFWGFAARVEEYRRYRVGCYARAGSTGRVITFHISWYDENGTFISWSDSPGAGSDASGAWSLHGYAAVAPPGAYYAGLVIWVGLANVANGEIHYIDSVEFREDVPGWDCTTAAKTFTFDSGTESWADGVFGSVTTAHHTGDDPQPVAGTGALKITTNGASGWVCFSPLGASGVPTTPGTRVSASIQVRKHPNVGTRTLEFGVDWYNGGTFLSASAIGEVVPQSNEWLGVAVEVIAPASTTHYCLKVGCDSSATGEIFYVDAAFGTIATNTGIFLTFDSNYVRSGGWAMGVQCIANGVANVLSPPGDSPTGVVAHGLPVLPGEYWDVSFWYKNSSSNSVKKSMLAVATVYDEDGNFLTPILGTYPITAAGSGWTPAHESFLIPDGARYMRIALAYLGSANDVVYVDDVVVHKQSTISAKVLPEGSVSNVRMQYNQQQVVITSLAVDAGVWEVSPTYRFPNPMTPVQLAITMDATLLAPGTTGPTVEIRMGISFDDGTTWNYGPTAKVLINNPGVDTYLPCATGHMITGMPTHDVRYRMEMKSSNDDTPSLQWAVFIVKVLPAPPAGSV